MSNVGSVRDSYLCLFVCRFITDYFLLFYLGSAQLSVPVVQIPDCTGFNVGASFGKPQSLRRPPSQTSRRILEFHDAHSPDPNLRCQTSLRTHIGAFNRPTTIYSGQTKKMQKQKCAAAKKSSSANPNASRISQDLRGMQARACCVWGSTACPHLRDDTSPDRLRFRLLLRGTRCQDEISQQEGNGVRKNARSRTKTISRIASASQTGFKLMSRGCTVICSHGNICVPYFSKSGGAAIIGDPLSNACSNARWQS